MNGDWISLYPEDQTEKGPCWTQLERVRYLNKMENGPQLNISQPLRPFTILPSDAGERARLQSQVFGPGHRLPTMSIDEYLEIERRNGNILTGGG